MFGVGGVGRGMALVLAVWVRRVTAAFLAFRATVTRRTVSCFGFRSFIAARASLRARLAAFRACLYALRACLNSAFSNLKCFLAMSARCLAVAAFATNCWWVAPSPFS